MQTEALGEAVQSVKYEIDIVRLDIQKLRQDVRRQDDFLSTLSQASREGNARLGRQLEMVDMPARGALLPRSVEQQLQVMDEVTKQQSNDILDIGRLMKRDPSMYGRRTTEDRYNTAELRKAQEAIYRLQVEVCQLKATSLASQAEQEAGSPIPSHLPRPRQLSTTEVKRQMDTIYERIYSFANGYLAAPSDTRFGRSTSSPPGHQLLTPNL